MATSDRKFEPPLGLMRTIPKPPELYKPRDAIKESGKAGLTTTIAGSVVAGAQNVLLRHDHGAMGIFTKFGPTIYTMGAMGFAFGFVSPFSANLREKDDALNPALGGAVAGAILGLRGPHVGYVIGHGFGLALLLGTFVYTGGSFRGFDDRTDTDEITRKEYIRQNFRRPYQETIDQLGEGRGIYGPGWEERRRQRIKEKYGVTVSEL